MIIWIVTTSLFSNYAFGAYSTLEKARKGLETFLKHDNSVISFEDTGNYSYTINTTSGDYWAEINFSVLDA